MLTLVATLIAGTITGQVVNKVIRQPQKTGSAQACVFHVHGSERNARAAAQKLAKDLCVNLVDLDTTAREIKVRLSDGGKFHADCLIDPNRIFTAKGLLANIGKKPSCTPASSVPGVDERRISALYYAVRDWRDKELLPALSECWTKRIGGKKLAGRLPVLAMHNNQNAMKDPQCKGSAMSVSDYVTGPEKGQAISVAGGKPGSPSDLFLATRAPDYAWLASHGFNSILQKPDPPKDDGSLSILLAKERYINSESFCYDSPARRARNEELGRAALSAFAVKACPAATGGSGGKPLSNPKHGSNPKKTGRQTR